MNLEKRYEVKITFSNGAKYRIGFYGALGDAMQKARRALSWYDAKSCYDGAVGATETEVVDNKTGKVNCFAK